MFWGCLFLTGSSSSYIQSCVFVVLPVQLLQDRVVVLSSDLLVHVMEALHGRLVPLDALSGDVQLGDEGQAATSS